MPHFRSSLYLLLTLASRHHQIVGGDPGRRQLASSALPFESAQSIRLPFKHNALIQLMRMWSDLHMEVAEDRRRTMRRCHVLHSISEKSVCNLNTGRSIFSNLLSESFWLDNVRLYPRDPAHLYYSSGCVSIIFSKRISASPPDLSARCHLLCFGLHVRVACCSQLRDCVDPPSLPDAITFSPHHIFSQAAAHWSMMILGQPFHCSSLLLLGSGRPDPPTRPRPREISIESTWRTVTLACLSCFSPFQVEAPSSGSLILTGYSC